MCGQPPTPFEVNGKSECCVYIQFLAFHWCTSSPCFLSTFLVTHHLLSALRYHPSAAHLLSRCIGRSRQRARRVHPHLDTLCSGRAIWASGYMHANGGREKTDRGNVAKVAKVDKKGFWQRGERIICPLRLRRNKKIRQGG